MMLPLGPLPATPGASSTASLSARPTGRRSNVSFLKFVPTVALETMSAAVPVTVTVSTRAATLSETSTFCVSAIVTPMFVRLIV